MCPYICEVGTGPDLFDFLVGPAVFTRTQIVNGCGIDPSNSPCPTHPTIETPNPHEGLNNLNILSCY